MFIISGRVVFDVDWKEWPSRLRHCYKNQNVLGSNPTRPSAGLRDVTLLQDS